MQQLATTIREQVDLLVDQYDARLRTRPGYSSLPEALRRDLERQFLNTIVECLEKGDSTILVDYARQRAAQWQALGLNLAWFQQALIIPEELLIPLVHSVAASNFVWQALNRSQSVIWQMMAEHAQHTEDRFRSIVETSHSGVLITDDTFHLTYVNDELLQISGYTREELLNLDFRQLLDEESRQLLVEHYIRRQRGEEAPTRYEVAFLRKDGTKRHLEMSAVSLKDASGKSYTVAQVLDVTEQKQAEAALAQERNLLRTLIDTLPDQVFVKDQQGRILLYNQADARAMRVDSIEAALGKTVYDLYPRELAETYHADDMAVIRSDQPLYDREEPALDEAGQERWVLTTKVPLKDQAGQRVGLVGIARDITRRKQAEIALRENEEKLRAIYEGSNDAVMLLNEQGFFDCNTQTLKLFGVDSKDVFVRLHPSDLSPALQPDGQDSLAASQQRIQTAYQQGYNRFDWVHRRLNGEDFPAEVLLSAFEYGGKRVLQATVRDITERKHAEEALAQSVEKQQKLTQRLRAAMEATDELMRLTDLDTLYRRAVELAREKLGVERCGLLLVDPTGQYVLGTYGTDEQGQTTDEHALRDPIATHQNVFNVQEGFGIVQEAAQRHWKDNEFHAVGTGWVGSTAIRGEAGPLGILYNDAAISKTPPDQDLQGTLAVYCSMLSNIIENKRLEQQVRDALQKEHNASERLRTVINIGYELIRTPDLDTLYRETVELAHARLGVERCGLYILDDTGDYLVGMYGTDDQGNTIDQRSPANRLPTAQGMERDLLFSPQKRLWTTLHKERTLWREGQLIELEPGWNVATVLQGPSGPRGILYNDAAISNAPYDETLQETIALYCTTVGNIIENKRLEQNIRESLLRRSIQVQTSIEVAQYVAAAPELGELFHRVVTLIKERFNYYHVQLFRYEPAEDTVKLITGYGKIGQKMLAVGHKLALGQGVVGTAAATGQAILAADVTRDLDWRPNPHLPATQGELAVPIKMGGGDAESQLNALKYFVQGNLDGMMITAIDPEAVAHITHASLQQGKPVVSVSTDLGEDNQTALVFSVEHELGYLLGVQAGNWAKQHVPDDQNVKLGMLNYRTLPQVLQRERGIIDGIQSVIGERVTIVVSGSATEAKEAAYLAQGWLRDHPELNMIVAINDATALGAYQAAQVMGRHDPDEFFIGGIDAVPEALAAIQQGGVYQATVNQPPEIMGLMAVRLLVAAIKGLPVKPVYTLYCMAVNRSNVAQFSGPSRKEMLFANQDIIPAELFSGLEVGGLRLGLSVLTLANPFFAALVKSAHEEAQRLGVQLVVNDPSHILGVLDIQSDQVNTLTDEDRLLLEGLCGQIASAMESTRLLERTETLYNISSRLNAAQTYDDVLTTLRLHTVLQQADLNISINLFDRPWIGDDIPEWSIALCRWSALPVSAVSSRYPLRAFSAASLLLHPDEPSIISDVQRDSRLDDATRELYGKRFGAGSTIFAPLVAAGQWIGYVNGIFQQPRTFSEEETRLLLAAVGQASTVIESLRRLDELTTSESQLSEALRASRLANWEYDIAADTFTFNDRFYALLRTTAEREGGYTMSAAQYAQRFVHPDDAALVGHEVQLAIETADPKFTRQIDHRIFYADGEMGYFNVRFRIEKDAQGRTIKTYGANQDITERKRAEAEREQLLATQQRRAVQLQTASEVSRAASSILNAEELLPQAAELIRARFGFYYVGIFLADETKHWAILQAGTGSAGQQMLANKHRLEIGGNSMIGQCLVTQQARIALDVGEEAVHFDNPLLPLTHSEMALPLISRGHIIGAMTIQSDQPAAFTADDIAVLQSMADQIANAVENARLYEQAQTALTDTDNLLRASAELNVSQSYDDVLTVIREHTALGRDALSIAINVFDRPWTVHQTPQWIELIGYNSRRTTRLEVGARFPLAVFTSAYTLLRADAPTLLEDLNGPEVDANTRLLFRQQLGAKSVIFVPVVVGGQWVGYVNVLFAEPTHFHEAEVRHLEALVGQAAVAVQNMRNLAGAQQALTETEASYRATQAIGRAQSTESILEAATPVVQLLGMTRASLRMITRRDLNGVIAAHDCYAYHLKDERWILQPVLKDAAVNDFASLKPLLRNPEEIVFGKDAQNPDSPMPEDLRRTLLADGLRSAVIASITVQNEVIGFLTFSGPQALAEAAEQRIRLTVGTLSDQIAVAVQNRQLFEQTRAALQEVDAINRRLTGEAWEDYLRQQAGREVIWAVADETAAPETLAQLDDQLVAGEMTIEPDPEDQTEATVTAPILLRGQPIGALRLRTPLADWSDDTQMMLADIADHIAQAVENARLIEQTQRTAQRERTINEINARVRQAVDLDAILRTAVNELGQSLKAARVVARIGSAAVEGAPATGDGRGKTND